MKKIVKFGVLFAAVITLALTSCKPKEPEIKATIPETPGVYVTFGDETFTAGEVEAVEYADYGIITISAAKTTLDEFPYVNFGLENSISTGDEFEFDGNYWFEYFESTYLQDGNGTTYGDWWADYGAEYTQNTSLKLNIIKYANGKLTAQGTISMFNALEALVDENPTPSVKTLTITLVDVPVETYTAPVVDIYDDEPTTATTINLTATQGGGVNYGDYYYVGGDNLYFQAVDNTGTQGVMVDFIATGSGLTSVPAGTYPINGTLGLNTVAAFVEEVVEVGGGSYVVYQGNYYFLVSGSVNVTSTGFALTGRSYNGSNITINYTGSLAVEAPSYAPARIAAKTNSLKSKITKSNKKLSLRK